MEEFSQICTGYGERKNEIRNSDDRSWDCGPHYCRVFSVNTRKRQAEALSAISPEAGPWWTTRFRSVAPTHLDSGDSTRHSSYGTADWSPGDARALSKLHVKFTYSGRETELSWAILYGTCGTASLPVIPMSNFPELDLSAGGSTEVNTTLTLEFPLSGSYHAEIYKDRIGGEEAVVACGDLKYVRG